MPNHVFIISSSKKDSILKARCELWTCRTQRGPVAEEMYRGLFWLLSLPFLLGLSSSQASQIVSCLCVPVCEKWQIVWVSGSVVEQKKHSLFLIYYLDSQGHLPMTSTQPLFPQSGVWLSGRSSHARRQRGCWVSLANDKLGAATPLWEPFSLAHLWHSHWMFFSPFGGFFLPSSFLIKTSCVSDHHF